MPSNTLKLVVGLGNPEPQYFDNRHNLGRMILERYLTNISYNTKSDANLKSQLVKVKSCFFAIPNTYMNHSGESVLAISKYYKILPQNTLVIHDDLDLPVGEYRFQFDRGPAGHNGVRSIIELLGTQQFYRLRIGVAHPQNIPVESYVLMPFTPEEKTQIDQVIDTITKEEIPKFLGL